MDRKVEILVTAAVMPELSPLIQRMASVSRNTVGGRSLSTGKMSGRAVGVLITGPGMVNTAQAMTAFLENMQPALIIHTGCAGIFVPTGGDIGDIAVATREIDIHTGLESDQEVCPAPLPFALLKKDACELKGHYPLDASLADQSRDILAEDFEPRRVKILSGPFITVSTITATRKRAQALYKAYTPIMESMEGSAAAHTALHYRVPFVEIRSASNRVEARDTSTWNLPLAFENCSRAAAVIIKHLDIERL